MCLGHKTKKPVNLNLQVLCLLWGEQDSNLRRFPNGFTVRPRWPLEYPPALLIAVANIALFLVYASLFCRYFTTKF